MKAEHKVPFIRGLQAIICSVVEDKIDDQALSKRLNGAAQWVLDRQDFKLDGGAQKRSVNEATDEEIVEIFEFWKDATGRPGVKLTPDRRTKIKARFRDGFSKDELFRVIEFVSGSSFHQGDNDRRTRYDWIKNIFLSHERVEELLEKAGQPVARGVDMKDHKQRERLEKEWAHASARGDNDACNRIQTAINNLSSNNGKTSGVCLHKK
jgi:hypothetical protein